MNPSFSSTWMQGWSADPFVLGSCALAAVAWWLAFGRRARWGRFAGAVALVLIALVSPLNVLAQGILFSAHMAQHILLLLLVPALAVLSLPRDFAVRAGRLAADGKAAEAKPPGSATPATTAEVARHGSTSGDRGPGLSWAAVGWAAGVGSMWIWHAPSLCDAAAINPLVHAGQTLSLIGCGVAFWWPILAPRESQRLTPALGVAYLFTACLACSALGILLTLAPVEVCSAFRAPLTATNSWSVWRERIGPDFDRQIGGLLMWIPMCLVYVGAIILELFRWLNPSPENETVFVKTGGHRVA